jgi:ABC-2 type transport system ATP-binding protein
VHASPDPAVTTRGLTKSFGSTRAVNGLNLSIPAGCVYGFLGPNGAGKTTTIRMLATLLRPDAGTATVLGHDVVHAADAVRERIALTGQFATLDEDLTGRENLVVAARLLGHRAKPARARADELLDAFNLTQAGARPVKNYSGGMRRRLDIAASLIATPQLLFLDEPTTGLDPASRSDVWQIVRSLAADGTTVLLTTQYLQEADLLADRLAVIDHGTVIAEGTAGELRAATGTGILHIRLADPVRRDDARRILARRLSTPDRAGDEEAGIATDSDPAVLTAAATDPLRAAETVADLARAGIALAAFSLDQPSLDEVFLILTGPPTAPANA